MRTHLLNPHNGTGVYALIADALAWRPASAANVARSAAPPVTPAPRRRGFFARVDDWLWRQQQRAIEAHLAKARDVYDLEVRIRDMERGDRVPYY
jgi:hypothetical protein